MKNKKIFGIVVGIIVIIIAVVFIKDKTGKQTVKDENNTTTVETTVIEQKLIRNQFRKQQ